MIKNKSMKRFALIGAAGYIAPRHMQAIRDTGNDLVAILDPSDSVGIIDSYFPRADYFSEPERFDRHLDKLRRQPGQQVDFVSICSPNYLHDAHIRLALRNGAHAICEKPLVLNPWNVDALQDIEHETGHNISVILQLRLHPAIQALNEKFDAMRDLPSQEVDLTYITSRGNWYLRSWKGDMKKSGGVATNIGIHFFDMLLWLFGEVRDLEVHRHDDYSCAGIVTLDRARVRWFLSIDEDHLPEAVRVKGQRTYRSITIQGEEIEFSGGFTDLHTVSYQKILGGEGFSAQDARSSIDLAYRIRNTQPRQAGALSHPFLNNIK